MFVLVVIHGLAEGTSHIPPQDRLSPVGGALIVAALSTFALGGIVLGVVDWRRRVAFGNTGVEIRSWRRKLVPWSDVREVQFCQVTFGSGTVPAAALVLQDGSRIELRALVQAGRRVRQAQVDTVARLCRARGVEVTSDGNWFWRRIELNGVRGGLRAAKPQ